jgi:hypothetical protein
MIDCIKKYGNVKNEKKTIEQIEAFCKMLRQNKVKATQEKFLELPPVVQCLFLQKGYEILNGELEDDNEDAYLTAFRLFKLFRAKTMKDEKIYENYSKLKELDAHYKKALEWNREKEGKLKEKTNDEQKITSTRASRSKKKYDKPYQRFETVDENDPLYFFYTSLYEENEKSPLAITFLTERGLLEGKERKALERKYEKLLEEKKLIH